MLTVLSLSVSAEFNMLRNGSFIPAKTDGEETAAIGWNYIDYGRMNNNLWDKTQKEYLSGYDCFKLTFKSGEMTIRYTDKEPVKDYFTRPHFLYNSSGRLPPPEAPEYRFCGEIRLNKGEVMLADTLKIKPKEGWQNFDFKLSLTVYMNARAHQLVKITAKPGMELSIRNFSLMPIYPTNQGKSVGLSGGGRLTRIQLPPGAGDDIKYFALLWQSWLWRLSGAVLPVSEKVDQTEGALSFRQVPAEQLPQGGWKILTDKNGVTVEYADVNMLSPALYDYIRHSGVRIYAEDTRQVPEQNPNLVLPPLNKTVSPHYSLNSARYYAGGTPWVLPSSAVDWYTDDHPVWDHNINTLLPMEKYRDKHPEYYMMTDSGVRQRVRQPFLVTPCFSSKDAVNIIFRRFKQMLENSYDRSFAQIQIGDRPVFCCCSECRKSGLSSSDILMKITNQAVKEISGTFPETKIRYSAYLQRAQPPEKVKPSKDIYIDFCLPPFTWPCNVHVECRENKQAISWLKNWSELATPGHVGIVTYEEERPWHYLEQIAFLNQYAKWKFHTFCSDPQIHYIGGRWNLGDQPEKVITEFNDGYYGPAGKYITEIQREIENFCKCYTHREGELSSSFNNVTVMSWVFNRHTILDRDCFNRLYRLLDMAEKNALKSSRIYRNHFYIFAFDLMRMDLAKYRLSTCITKAETAAFIARLKQFLGYAHEVNTMGLTYPDSIRIGSIMHGASPTLFLEMVAGIKLSAKPPKDWTRDPNLLKIMEEPEKHLILEPVRMSGLTVFAPGVIRGGKGPSYYSWQCPKRMMKSVSRPSSGRSEMSVIFALDKEPTGSMILKLTGLDDDKPGKTTIDILVNGKKIFSGANTFEEHDWKDMNFTILSDILKKGDNVIVIRNTVPERTDEKAKIADGEIFIGQSGSQDYTWGWVGIASIVVLDPSRTFSDFIAGDSKSLWKKIGWMNKPEGIIEVRDGKLYMQSKGAPFTGIYLPIPKPYELKATNGDKLRFTVVAQGVGRIGYWAYGSDGKYIGRACAGGWINQKELKKLSFEFTVAEGVAKITPYITASKTGITIESVQIEALR